MMTIQTKEGFDNIIYYTIIILSNEKGNNHINYTISENIKSFIEEEAKTNDDNNIISKIRININPLPNIFSSSKIWFKISFDSFLYIIILFLSEREYDKY